MDGITGCGGEGKFMGCAKGFCPNFSKLARKNFGPLFVRTFSHEDRIGRHFLKPNRVGRHFLKPNRVGRHFRTNLQGVCPDFQRFCKGFHRICPDFPRFCPDFQGYPPNQYFGGALAPRPLHHWVAPQFRSNWKYHTIVTIAVSIHMLSVALTEFWFAIMKAIHSMCGPHEDTDIIFCTVRHFGWHSCSAPFVASMLLLMSFSYELSQHSVTRTKSYTKSFLYRARPSPSSTRPTQD